MALGTVQTAMTDPPKGSPRFEFVLFCVGLRFNLPAVAANTP